MTQKRTRGRPKGSGIDDARHLEAVADLLVRNRDMKKTPAIEAVVQRAFPENQFSAAVRRLLRKWNASEPDYRAAASERLAEAKKLEASERRVREAPKRLSAFQRFARDAMELQSQAQALRDLIDPPTKRALRQQAAEVDKLRHFIDPPLVRQVRQLHEQAAMIERALGRF